VPFPVRIGDEAQDKLLSRKQTEFHQGTPPPRVNPHRPARARFATELRRAGGAAQSHNARHPSGSSDCTVVGSSSETVGWIATDSASTR
jgi:hypothetical protein